MLFIPGSSGTRLMSRSESIYLHKHLYLFLCLYSVKLENECNYLIIRQWGIHLLFNNIRGSPGIFPFFFTILMFRSGKHFK